MPHAETLMQWPVTNTINIVLSEGTNISWDKSQILRQIYFSLDVHLFIALTNPQIRWMHAHPFSIYFLKRLHSCDKSPEDIRSHSNLPFVQETSQGVSHKLLLHILYIKPLLLYLFCIFYCLCCYVSELALTAWPSCCGRTLYKCIFL